MGVTGAIDGLSKTASGVWRFDEDTAVTNDSREGTGTDVVKATLVIMVLKVEGKTKS